MNVLELAFVARLEGAAEFTSLARLSRGWPKRLLTEPVASKFPIVTWFTPTRIPLGSQPARVQIQTDAWVWPDPDLAAGGLERLDAIDAAMLELFGDESAITWSYVPGGGQTIWVSSVCIDSGDPPEDVLRRRRLWEVSLA